MRLLLGLMLSFVVAAGIGLGSTWYALTQNLAFGSLSLGAWKAFPRSGTVGIDPYARAAIARNGELPVGLGDGIAFTATVDDGGRPLDGRYYLRIWDSPDLNWSALQDIQLILEYEIPKWDGDLGQPNLYVALSESAARRKSKALLDVFATADIVQMALEVRIGR